MTLFEGTFHRIFKKIAVLLARPDIVKSVDFARFVTPEEQVAAREPSAAGHMIAFVQNATMRACGSVLSECYDPRRRQFKCTLAEQKLGRAAFVTDLNWRIRALSQSAEGTRERVGRTHGL